MKEVDEIMFSDAIRQTQSVLKSRAFIEKRTQKKRWKNALDEEQIDFIAQINSFYFGSASAQGRPYVQHRGGEKGFVEVVDSRTLLFPDYKGNRQFISIGNLSENDQAFIFIMDYANKRRLKLWGRARVMNPTHERAIQFRILALDENCRQHIPDLIPRSTYLELKEEFDELQKENKRLRTRREKQ